MLLAAASVSTNNSGTEQVAGGVVPYFVGFVLVSEPKSRILAIRAVAVFVVVSTVIWLAVPAMVKAGPPSPLMVSIQVPAQPPPPPPPPGMGVNCAERMRTITKNPATLLKRILEIIVALDGSG
jgi:hypothetical protein